MPRLPTGEDLGAVSAPRVIVGVPSYNTSGDPTSRERAMGQVGASITGLGDAIAQIDQKLTKARQASELSDAVGRAVGELGELELAHQRDQDFKTSTQRFSDKSELIRQRYEESISDPIVRGAFNTKFREIFTSKKLNVMKFAATQEGDYNVAALDRNLDTYARHAANAVNVAERDLVINQADIDIATMRSGGWITDVQAGDRKQKFLVNMDEALVRRDLSSNASTTAIKLGTSPEYAPHLSPKRREELTDHAYRRAETERVAEERRIDKERQQIGDELMKQAVAHSENGTLTPEFVERVSPWVTWHERQALGKMLRGEPEKEDDSVIGEIESLIRNNNPQAALDLAFRAQKNHLIKGSTLHKYQNSIRSHERQEGPKSPFERNKEYLGILDPGPFVGDVAGRARYRVALREYEDFASEKQRTGPELREKADELVKKYTVINMEELVRSTGMANQPTPEQTIERLNQRAEELKKQREEKKIDQYKFNREMEKLNRAKKAAEKAAQAHGR